MKKKIFNKATVLFLAIMMVLATFNFSIIASDYVDETVDMSALEVVDESVSTEESALFAPIANLSFRIVLSAFFCSVFFFILLYTIFSLFFPFEQLTLFRHALGKRLEV